MILSIAERLIIGAFQFDAQGKVVARLTPLETRDTGMPGPIQAGNELGDGAVTLDQKMRRNTQIGDPGKIGMLCDIKAILEEFLHLAGAELPRRQADVVNHQQGNLARRTFIEIG